MPQIPSPLDVSPSTETRLLSLVPRPLRSLIGPAAVVLLICLFQWPILSGIYKFEFSSPDLANMTFPDFEIRAHALREGVIPIWNPYQFAGEPALGHVKPAVLDPLSFLLLAAPLKDGHIALRYIDAYFVFLHCLAGLAAYFLARELRVRIPLSVIAGVFYAVGGMTGNTGWIEFLTQLVYPPLVLLFLLRSLRGRRSLANAALSGALLGISWFSGTHHIALVTSLACVAVWLIFLPRPNLRVGVARLLVFGGVMVGVSAPQILPALEFGARAYRWIGLPDPVAGTAKVPLSAHLTENLTPTHLVNLILPTNFSYWGAGSDFIGIVALVFALIAIRMTLSTRLTKVLLAIACGGVLMTLSTTNIFYGFTYWVVPEIDKLRECIFWIALTHLAMTCLFAIGMEWAMENRDALVLRKTSLPLAIGGTLLLFAGGLLTVVAKPEWQSSLEHLAFSGLVALLLAGWFLMMARQVSRPLWTIALLAGILLLEQGNVSGRSGALYYLPKQDALQRPFLAAVRSRDDLAAFLRSRSDLMRVDVDRIDVPENFGNMHRIEEVSGFEPSMLRALIDINYWTPKIRQILSVNYYIARKPSAPDQVDLFTDPSGMKVFSNPGARPRVWSVHRLLQSQDYSDARRIVSDPAFDSATTAFLQAPLPQLASCGAEDQVRLLHRTWFAAKIDANMSCKGMVILSDIFYPGWHATVDGQTAKIYAADMLVRGIVTEAGHHTIEIRYQPWSFYLGLLLFAGATAFTAFLWRKKEHVDESPLDLLN